MADSSQPDRFGIENLPDPADGAPGGAASDAQPADATETSALPRIPLIHAAGAHAARGRHAAGPAFPNPEDLDPEDAAAYEALRARRAERRRKKLVRRGIALGAVAVIAIAGFALANVLNQQPEQTFEPITDIAMAGTYTSEVDARGSLEPLSSTAISPTVDGTIAEVRVAAGQQVAAGDVLMVINNPELDVAVADAERALAAARDDLAASQRALREAKQAASQPAAVDPETGMPLESAPVDTAAAQDAVNASQRALESAQAAYDQAVARVAERTVTAPIAGSVVSVNAQVGASTSDPSASGGTGPLMQIADLSQMKTTIQVSEEDIARVATGQQATVTFPAFDDIVLEGTVQNIASIASGAGDMMYSGDGSSVTFAVDVLLPAPDPRLKPGMTASVALTTERYDNVVMVPTMALMTDDGQSYYVMRETDPETHEAERVDVTVATRNNDYAVVGANGPAEVTGPGGTPLAEAPLTDGDVLVISTGVASGDAGALNDTGASGGAVAL